MAVSNFTYQIEYTQKKGSYVPLLSSPMGIMEVSQYTPIINPLKFRKKKPEVIELSRQERMYSAKSRVFERFKQRFIESKLPGSDYAIAFLEHKKLQGLVANTLRSSGSVVFAYLSHIHSVGCNLEEISKEEVASYVEHEQDRGNSIVSIKTKLSALYTFISYLVDRDVVDPDILRNKIKVRLPDPLPRSINFGDIEKLLSVLESPVDKVIILLLLRTGMRIGELLELQVTDINLNEQKIMIYEGGKTFQGRVVYFSDDAKKALLSWLRIRDSERKYLFYGREGAPLTYVAAWHRITKCFNQAGLSHKGYSPHCLRHTFATEALNAGMRLDVVQQILGHSNIEVTLRYARLTDNTREEEYFRAMTKIDQGGKRDEHNRLNSQLQAVFEKKKLFSAHD